MKLKLSICDACLPDEIVLATVEYVGENGQFHACSTHAELVREAGHRVVKEFEYPGNPNEYDLPG